MKNKTVKGFLIVTFAASFCMPIRPFSDSDREENSTSQKRVPVTIDTVDFLNREHVLKNSKLIKQKLFSLGFKKVNFVAQDGHRNHGLFLQRPNAKSTVLIVGGLYTEEEFLAPLFYMFPNDCNILFLNSYYDEKKIANFMKKISNFAKNEYYDVIAAMNFLKETVPGPLIVYGYCAGAFFAGRALVSLAEQNKLAPYNVKGLVFDSGYGSITHIADRTPAEEIKRKLSSVFIDMGIARKKEKVLKLPIFKFLNTFLTTLINCIKKPYLDNKFKKRDKAVNFFNRINILDIPIFYIHSADDTFSSIAQAKRLASLSKKPYCWWIPAGLSKHAQHHFRLSEFYASHIHHFHWHVLNNVPLPYGTDNVGSQ